jgi:hypothetical protein
MALRVCSDEYMCRAVVVYENHASTGQVALLQSPIAKSAQHGHAGLGIVVTLPSVDTIRLLLIELAEI